MNRQGLSIAGLMIFVAYLAVVLAAWRQPSIPAASVLYSFGLVLNFVAVVTGLTLTGRTRSVAVGYAVWGWGYFLFAFTPLLQTKQTPPLITDSIVAVIVDLIEPGHPFTNSEMIGSAHCLVMVAAGLLGGSLAWSLTRSLVNSPARETPLPG